MLRYFLIRTTINHQKIFGYKQQNLKYFSVITVDHLSIICQIRLNTTNNLPPRWCKYIRLQCGRSWIGYPVGPNQRPQSDGLNQDYTIGICFFLVFLAKHAPLQNTRQSSIVDWLDGNRYHVSDLSVDCCFSELTQAQGAGRVLSKEISISWKTNLFNPWYYYLK